MIFVPSPQALLHGNHPNYTKLNLSVSMPSDDSNLTEKEYHSLEEFLIDRALLNSPNSNNPVLISYLNAIIAIGVTTQYEITFASSSNYLFLGLLSLQYGDILNAIHFLNIAAEKGNNHAIILLSKLHFFYPNFYTAEPSIEISKRYLMNAYRHSSNDSLFYLGELYRYSNNYILALYFFYRHFRIIDSNISVLNICQLIKDYINNDKLARKWMLYSISRGEPIFIESVIYGMFGNDFNKQNFSQISNLWKNVISNFTKIISLPNQSNIFSSKLLKSSQVDDKSSELDTDIYINSKFNLKTEQNSEQIAKPILNKINDIHTEPIQFCSSIQHIQEFHTQNSIHHSNLNTASKKYNYISFYPSKNKSKLILDIFELSSSDFKKRNLKLAEVFISELYNHFTKGILCSEIFKLRSNSKNHKWLTSCGFIYLLLGDIDSGFRIFLKASKLGNFCATMMCGFLLFHWKHDQEKMKKDSCFFFLKCTTDPIALIHLSFLLNDTSMLDRACSILGIKSRIQSIFWLVNLLIEGTKMPPLFIRVAKIICIAGIEFGLRNNEDTTDLYDCYIRHFK